MTQLKLISIAIAIRWIPVLLEVDWNRVRRETESKTVAEFRRYATQAQYGSEALKKELLRKIAEAEHGRRLLVQKIRATQQRNMNNLDRSVSIGLVGEHVATKVRNLSARALMLTATVIAPVVAPFLAEAQ